MTLAELLEQLPTVAELRLRVIQDYRMLMEGDILDLPLPDLIALTIVATLLLWFAFLTLRAVVRAQRKVDEQGSTYSASFGRYSVHEARDPFAAEKRRSDWEKKKLTPKQQQKIVDKATKKRLD